MDQQVNTCPVFMQTTLLDQTAENPFDLDIHLPEYYPDVQRILRCTVRPNLQSVAVSGDRVSAEGSGTLRMVYASEDKTIASFEQSVPISRTVHSTVDLSGAVVAADARTDFVNCRASGQRRVGVHGVISVRVRAFGRESQPIVVGTASDTLQMKTESVRTLSLTGMGERVFAMSEVVELGSEDPSVDKILRAQAALRVDSTKAVKDKLLVKGEASVEWTYLPVDGDTPQRIRHSLPISQILETAGVSEDDAQDVTLSVQELLIAPKPDGSGENRLVDVALRIRAHVRTGALVEADAVTDVYATSGEIQTVWADTELVTPTETIRDTMTVRQTVELPGADVSRILDVGADAVTAETRCTEDGVEAACTASLAVLYTDADGEPAVCETGVDFLYSRRCASPGVGNRCEMQVQIASCKASAADGGAEVQIEAVVSGTVCAVETRRLLRSVRLLDTQDDGANAALTIYFADPGESVWDIARRYRTTTEAILQENDLTEDTVPEKRMLVIPCN